MRDKTIIRRAVDAIRHISRLFLVNRTGGPVQCRVGKVGTTLRCVSQQLYASERAQRSELSHAGGLTGPEPLRGETMSIELKDCLLNSGAALVLHGERDLIDADLAQLRGLSEKQRAAITAVVLSNTHITGECFQHLALLPNLIALYGGGTRAIALKLPHSKNLDQVILIPPGFQALGPQATFEGPLLFK